MENNILNMGIVQAASKFKVNWGENVLTLIFIFEQLEKSLSCKTNLINNVLQTDWFGIEMEIGELFVATPIKKSNTLSVNLAILSSHLIFFPFMKSLNWIYNAPFNSNRRFKT